MKRAKKIIVVWIFVLTLLVSNQSLVFATTYHTTGTLADGLYMATQATPDSDDNNPTEYRISVLIAGGAVSLVQFGEYVKNMRFAKTFANAISDADKKAGLLAVCDEQDYYQAQANTLLDGAKVAKYSEAKSDDMYKAFQALWKNTIEQAGGKVASDSVSIGKVSGLKATVTGHKSIKLTWKAVTDASGYKVYRATSATGSYKLVKTTTSKSFTNTGLKAGTKYYYKVKAYKESTNGKVSAVVSAKPAP